MRPVNQKLPISIIYKIFTINTRKKYYHCEREPAVPLKSATKKQQHIFSVPNRSYLNQSAQLPWLQRRSWNLASSKVRYGSF